MAPFFMEEDPFMTEREVYDWIQESAFDPAVVQLREELVDPVISVLQDSNNVKKYIDLGSEFIEANAEMLAKPYPSKRVSYPRKYVDRVLELFGFTVASCKKIIRNLLHKYINESEFYTITSYPTNVIHVVVLIFSDMLTDESVVKEDRNNLRDSARQQLGLTIYGASLEYQFHYPHPKEDIMSYTYSRLDRTWNIVRKENIISWITDRVETGYMFFRSQMSLNLTPQLLVNVLNRIRNSFRQDLRTLATQYFKDMEEGHSIAADVTADDDADIERDDLIRIRNALLRKISGGDSLFTHVNDTYRAIGQLKNVRPQELCDFMKTVNRKDIGFVIDMILYVYITKDGNSIDSINSTKYIGKITKFPTAIDRVIAGKPVILPLTEKYEVDSKLIKAMICFIATYIMQRINDVMEK